VSAFASPVVMVPKRDGSLRFAIDYRKLNAQTVKAVYHLPLIPDIIDEISGSKIYTTFDFSSGFHQIPVHPKHKERTAFTTFLGLFQYTRMPFGLCGAPITFTRVMQELKRYLSSAFLIYIDDVVLASETESKHLEDIDQFLKAVIQFGMKLKMNKCCFGQGQIKYLGFLINELGIKIDPGKVEVIEKFSKPTTLTELRSFLGATSYFRKFIAGFSIITSPLNELMREGKFCTPDKWTKEQEQAFETLKEKLKSAPVLSAPRLDRPFIIETDASLKGIASTLLQKDMKGAEHPIAFASKTLKPYQTRYHINELELYAVVFAVKQF
jgi:hypothetical protein